MLQAQAKADKDAEVAKAALEAAQQQAASSFNRAEEAEQKLASETAAHTDNKAKLAGLQARPHTTACMSSTHASVF